MDMLSLFFQLDPVPSNQIIGSYDISIVILSYIVATAASFIALDITGRLRDAGNTQLSQRLWLLGGGIAMGAGIWSMHFIGMLAFKMAMPMSYNKWLTLLSLVVAIGASFFALSLLKSTTIKTAHLAIGGIILGLAIATMHYIGMAAMTTNMSIHYWPGLFFLSILIAIVSSETAFYLAIKSNQGRLEYRFRLKVLSALVMGAAICGMHYTGMFAAVFTHTGTYQAFPSSINPSILSTLIAIVTFCVLGVAFSASNYKDMVNEQVVHLAHQSGMAEVASNVLHNVGNVLNSVNISAELVYEYTSNSKLIGLIKVSEILNAHKDDLASYITDDQKGKLLPEYIQMLAIIWQKEQLQIMNEMQLQRKKIQHIKDVISIQQSLGGLSSLRDAANINDLLDEAIKISSINFQQNNIVVEKYYEKIKPVVVDKPKLQQIFINLIRNANDALNDSPLIEQKKLIIKLINNKPESIIIRFIDNGIGIAPDNMKLIFSHGFSTKKDGHGFGLHACAIAAYQLDGSLKAESEGLGKGAVFTLEFPYRTKTGEYGGKKANSSS